MHRNENHNRHFFLFCPIISSLEKEPLKIIWSSLLLKDEILTSWILETSRGQIPLVLVFQQPPHASVKPQMKVNDNWGAGRGEKKKEKKKKKEVTSWLELFRGKQKSVSGSRSWAGTLHILLYRKRAWLPFFPLSFLLPHIKAGSTASQCDDVIWEWKRQG